MITKFKKKISKDIHLTELLKGASVAFIFRIVGLALGYIFTIFIARAYGANAMGIYTLSLTVFNIAVLIAKLGLDTAMLKFVAEYSAQKKWIEIKKIYWKIIALVVPIAIAITLSAYFLSPLIAQYIFHKPYLSEYFQIVSIAILPFVLLSINREAIRGLKNIKVYSMLTNVLVALLATIILIILYFYSHDIHLYDNKNKMPLIAQVGAIVLTSFISILAWFNRRTRKDKKKQLSKTLNYRDILSVSTPMLVTSSMGLIMGSTDIIMLGMFATELDVGVYNVALKVSMITSISLTAINTISAPKFAAFWGERDIKGLSKMVRQSTQLIFWTSFPVLAILLFFPKWILGYFGQEFIIGSTALMALAVGQFINSASGSVGQIMNMTNNQFFLQYTSIISAVINVVLNYILIPKYGVVGAALSTAASGVIWNIMCIIFIKSRLGVSTWYFPLLRSK